MDEITIFNIHFSDDVPVEQEGKCVRYDRGLQIIFEELGGSKSVESIVFFKLRYTNEEVHGSMEKDSSGLGCHNLKVFLRNVLHPVLAENKHENAE
jgi:hypothetical protein